jgi:hypothetical protein
MATHEIVSIVKLPIPSRSCEKFCCLLQLQLGKVEFKVCILSLFIFLFSFNWSCLEISLCRPGNHTNKIMTTIIHSKTLWNPKCNIKIHYTISKSSDSRVQEGQSSCESQSVLNARYLQLGVLISSSEAVLKASSHQGILCWCKKCTQGGGKASPKYSSAASYIFSIISSGLMMYNSFHV